LEFIYDQLIIVGSYILSYAIVHLNSDLKKLLIPMPVKDKYTLGRTVMFRFIPLSKSKTDVPYNILILLLFLIFAFLTKALFHNNENWLLFWVGYMGVFLVILSITYKVIVIVVIVALYSIPLALANYLGLGPKGIGIIVGVIPGVFGGMYIGINYWLTRARVDNEVHHKQELDGTPLGFFGLLMRRIKSVWLKWSALLAIIALVGFLMDWNKAVGDSIGGSTGFFQYGSVFLWTLISLNIFLFSVPLLIEMVQQASWTSAGLFSDKVQDKEGDELRAYVNKYGKYSGFSLATGLILGMMCLAIGAIISGNIVEKLLLANILSPAANEYLFISATFLSGFIFSVHLGFVIVYLAFLLIPRMYVKRELVDPIAIIKKILYSHEKIHEDLRSLLSTEELKSIRDAKDDKSKAKIEACSILNTIIDTEDLYIKVDFESVDLGKESKMLLSMEKYGQVVKRINKHLVADVFRDEIKRKKRNLRDALTFREYIQLRKMGLNNSYLRFYMDADMFFYPTVEVVEESSVK